MSAKLSNGPHDTSERARAEATTSFTSPNIYPCPQAQVYSNMQFLAGTGTLYTKMVTQMLLAENR